MTFHVNSTKSFSDEINLFKNDLTNTQANLHFDVLEFESGIVA